MTLRALTLASLILALGACGRADSPFSPAGTVVQGTWGSNDTQIVTSDSMTVVRVGCDEGHFSGHFLLDASGDFSASGTWTQGFLATFYGPQTVAAQITGRMVGTTITFAVAAVGLGGEPVLSTGPRSVTLGVAAAFATCGV